MPRRLLVTSALPYANGHIHIGHLVEYIQTDIWVRFQKLFGNDCRYMCADDTHGTAIMIRARQEGRSEEEVIADMQAAHEQDFAGFGIEFDNYGSTHSEENRALCHEIWSAIRKANLVKEESVEQLFDPQAGTFLADRFVRGTCPKCKSADQPGDNCSVCGHHYTPIELIDPVSTLTGAKPEVRSALHLFIELEKLHGFLAEWTQSGDHLQPEIANYLQGHFLGDPLRDWDISRPAPYFGFEIPDSPGNYWYVWFDAPIGYIASTWQWCKRNGQKLDDWWKSPDCEVHHFIGKDITYFHTLFWPGMLKTAGFSLPTKVHIHGFLTVDGEKMSKSKGTFVRARTYLNHLDPSYLRYFYATKLSSRVDDLDMAIDEFIAKVNTDLVNKVVNLASRTAKFVEKTGLSAKYPDDGGLFAAAAAAGDEIAAAYEECDFNKAMRLIVALADRANPFVEENKPWELRKDPANAERLQDVCTIALNLFRQLAIYLAPVLPKLAQQTGDLLNDPITSWKQAATPLVGTPVAKFTHMLQRVEEKDLLAMIEESKEEAAAATPPAPAGGAADKWNDSGDALAAEPLAPECTIDDFAKVDLRVARIISAEEVPDARKLLKLQLSLGGGVTKQVFAGIKAYYEPEQLVGRLVVCVANLAPRTMKFGVSEGMIAAAGGGTEAYLLTPDSGAKPGHRLH
ncbi:methionine--tRNA ligase [Lacipirellula parvula]|uniref:Methionine--tRNA ligase n=1 Tax=Lacipirellula parvula TaxID=2650471 RepID=A0A5K7X5K7_9BACT|nr:methionine--tRNA ligase [Lacipirellula parvula]BBO31117.1 methionyl-tRNA synthetase [Lacipirellula parvula]